MRIILCSNKITCTGLHGHILGVRGGIKFSLKQMIEFFPYGAHQNLKALEELPHSAVRDLGWNLEKDF